MARSKGKAKKAKPSKQAPVKKRSRAKPAQPRGKPKKLAAKAAPRKPRAMVKRSARKGRSKRDITAERIAESIRTSERAVVAKKGAKVRTRRRRARERLGQIEARIAEAGPRAQEVYGHLVAALQRMQSTARSQIELDLELDAPREGKTPWMVVGRFIPADQLAYDTLGEVFRTWEDDLILEATVHPRRLAWIRWEYVRRGKVEGYAPGGIGEWNRVISEARQECDPDDETSLAGRYLAKSRDEDDEPVESEIVVVQVYLSAHVISGRTVRL